MEMRKVLIADGTEEFRTALAQALQGLYHVQVCSSGPQTMSVLSSFRPDILVLDLMIPGLDGITILQTAAASGICPMVLASVTFSSVYISEAMDRLQVEYLVTRPCNIPATVARIADLSRKIRPPMHTVSDPRSFVSDILVSLGIPSRLRGFSHVREAILLMAKDPAQSITKELYPSVSAISGDRCKNIEHTIRTAIDKGWQNRDDRVWHTYFALDATGTVPRPSNAEFIHRLADYLLMSQNKPVD